MKHLLLMRHAKTEPGGGGRSDRARRLTGRGRDNASSIGTQLLQQGLVPDLGLVSDAVRTRETWLLLSEAAQFDCDTRFESVLYLAPPSAYVKLLASVDEAASSVLMIGHNPGMEQLVRGLSGKVRHTADRLLVSQPMRTGTLCVFEVSGRWDELDAGASELVACLQP